MKLLPTASVMDRPLQNSVLRLYAAGQYPAAVNTAKTCVGTVYAQMNADVARNGAFIWTSSAEIAALSRAVVEVRPEFVDRCEPHHAFGHLRLNGSVGVERIGHAVD